MRQGLRVSRFRLHHTPLNASSALGSGRPVSVRLAFPAMTGDELIALEHENWIAYLTGVVSCASQATVTHAGGVVTILTGLPFDWFNQVLVEHEEATRDGVLAGVARAREQGDPFVVRLREGIDDRFVRTLADAGLEPAMEPSTPGMVAFPIDHAIARPPELEIRRVTDATGIDVHRQVVTQGSARIQRSPWKPPARTSSTGPSASSTWATPAVPRHLRAGLAKRADHRRVQHRDPPVSATTRAWRGDDGTRGADGVDADCDVATLQASEIGRPIYERQGFRTVVRYVAYVERTGPREPIGRAAT